MPKMKEPTWEELLEQAEIYAKSGETPSFQFLRDLNMSEIRAEIQGGKKIAKRIMKLYYLLDERLRKQVEQQQKNTREKMEYNKAQAEKNAIEQQKVRRDLANKMDKLYIEKSNDPEEAKKTVAKRKAAREAGQSVRPKIESQNSFSEDEDDEEMVALAAAEQAYEQAQHDALKKKIFVAPIPEGFKSISIKRPDQENIDAKNGIDSAFTEIHRRNAVKLSDGQLYNDVTIMKLYDKAYETCVKHGRDVNNINIILQEFISPYKVPFNMHDLEIALTLKRKYENNYGEGNSTKPPNRNATINANRNENINASKKRTLSRTIHRSKPLTRGVRIKTRKTRG